MRVCRYCHAPVALTGPAGWGSLDDFYPDLHCPESPDGGHRVLVLADVMREIAGWLR